MCRFFRAAASSRVCSAYVQLEFEESAACIRVRLLIKCGFYTRHYGNQSGICTERLCGLLPWCRCDDMWGVKDNAAGQAYYDSLIALYSEWGVDFIKMDCAYSQDVQYEFIDISRSISKASRDIALSMSPTNRDPSLAQNVKDFVTMYRINGEKNCTFFYQSLCVVCKHFNTHT